MQALRQLADEALEETVPERLLQVIRAAKRRRGADGEPAATQADDGLPDQPDEPA